MWGSFSRARKVQTTVRCKHCGTPLFIERSCHEVHMFCPKCGSPIPEDAVFCMNCGEKIETAAPEADSAPAEITPAEKAPIPTSGKKPKKKKAVLRARTSACRRGSCQQQPVPKQHCRKSGKAYRRQLERSISGKWRRYHPRKKSRWALPAPLKRVVRLQFHSQNAPFLIYPST